MVLISTRGIVSEKYLVVTTAFNTDYNIVTI